MAVGSSRNFVDRWGRGVAAVAAGAALLMMTACSGPSAGPAAGPGGGAAGGGAAQSDAIKVNRLVFIVGTPGRTELDLRFLAEPYVWPWRGTYDNLVAADAKTGKLVPGAATEWNVEPNGQSFRFKIRPDLNFHGKWGPVRGEDVKFGWDQLVLADSLHGQMPYFKNNVKSVEAPSAKEVVFHMNKPDGILVTAVSDYQGGSEIRSKASYDSQGVPNWKNGALAGSGPYLYKEGAEGQFLRFERANDNHWSGTPDFAEFEWRFAKEASTRMAALLTGEAHMADLPNDLMAQAEKQAMKVYRGQFPGTRVWASFRCCFAKDITDPSGTPMFPDSPLLDKRVRQALSKAINRDEMNKAFFSGKGETMYLNHFHPNRLGWNPDWEKRFKDMYGYDPAAAKKLLADAGQASLKVHMLVKPLPGVPGGEDLTEAVASYWRAIGANVSLETVDVAQQNLIARQFGYSNETTLDATGSNQWSGSTIWNSGVTHLGNGVESTRVDTVLRQIGQTVDAKKQEELWRQAGDFAYDDFLGAPMFWLPTEAIGNPKVVAEWTYPGGITGAWTHIVNIRAAAK